VTPVIGVPSRLRNGGAATSVSDSSAPISRAVSPNSNVASTSASQLPSIRASEGTGHADSLAS
jgi:hypothetical protein